MTRDEVLALPGRDNPCLLADGKMGMLITHPGTDDRCGVQVPGEEDIRWMASADLSCTLRGALRQTGAPEMPPATAQDDMVQMMLCLDWAQRGGPLKGEWL